MRAFRILGSVLAAFVGVLALVLGGTVAFLLGPNDTIESDEQQFSTDGVAVVLPEQLMEFYGPTLHVTASGSEKLFLGAAHSTYVQDYLSGDVGYNRVDEVSFPFEPELGSRTGDEKVTEPTELDWWSERTSGSGEQELAWTLPDGPYDVVLMRADGQPGFEVDTRFGVELDGGFVTALLVALFGVALLAGSVLLGRGRRDDRAETAPPATGVSSNAPPTGPGSDRTPVTPPAPAGQPAGPAGQPPQPPGPPGPPGPPSQPPGQPTRPPGPPGQPPGPGPAPRPGPGPAPGPPPGPAQPPPRGPAGPSMPQGPGPHTPPGPPPGNGQSSNHHPNGGRG